MTAALDAKEAYGVADFGVIEVYANCNLATQHFRTLAVENVTKRVMKYNPETIMVIKSINSLAIRI